MSPGFNDQLVRALLRGCPVCRNHEFAVAFIDVSTATVTEKDGTLKWSERQRQSENDELRVTCPSCYTLLWTPQTGWANALADLETG